MIWMTVVGLCDNFSTTVDYLKLIHEFVGTTINSDNDGLKTIL